MTRLTRGLAAGSLAAGTVLAVAAPADAGKPVYENFTTVSAYAYHTDSDRMELSVAFDTALKGSPAKAAATMSYEITWLDGSGATVGSVASVQGVYPRSTYWYVVAVRPAGAVQVRATGSMTLSRGTTAVDSFDIGTQACGGTWTETAITLFTLDDTD